MKKQMKKIFAVVMALTMVFTMSATVFADEANPEKDTNAYYYQTDDAAMYTTSEDITVYVTVESSRNAINGDVCIKEKRIPVTLEVPEGGSKKFSVTDALVELQNDAANQAAYGLEFLDKDSKKIETGKTYFKYVKQNGTTYGPTSALSFDGWMVKINDRFTIDTYVEAYGGLTGETINTMYLKNGDDVHLYMDYTTSSLCVPFTRLVTEQNENQLTVTVEESHNYFGLISPHPWTITSYETYTKLSSFTVNIYDAKGSEVATGSGSKGVATVDVSSLTPGTYTVVLDHAFKSKSKSLKYTMSYKDFVIS